MNSSSKLKRLPLLMKIDFCKCLHRRGPRGLDEKMHGTLSWSKQFYGSLDKSVQQEMWYLFFDSSNFYFTRHFRSSAKKYLKKIQIYSQNLKKKINFFHKSQEKIEGKNQKYFQESKKKLSKKFKTFLQKNFKKNSK